MQNPTSAQQLVDEINSEQQVSHVIDSQQLPSRITFFLWLTSLAIPGFYLTLPLLSYPICLILFLTFNITLSVTLGLFIWLNLEAKPESEGEQHSVRNGIAIAIACLITCALTTVAFSYHLLIMYTIIVSLPFALLGLREFILGFKAVCSSSDSDQDPSTKGGLNIFIGVVLLALVVLFDIASLVGPSVYAWPMLATMAVPLLIFSPIVGAMAGVIAIAAAVLLLYLVWEVSLFIINKFKGSAIEVETSGLENETSHSLSFKTPDPDEVVTKVLDNQLNTETFSGQRRRPPSKT